MIEGALLAYLAGRHLASNESRRPMNVADRHPGVAQIARYFEYDHLPPHLQEVSKPCHDLAAAMIEAIPDGPELTTGLRKLLEAKDCFVRAALHP